jgi:hypothetical protein
MYSRAIPADIAFHDFTPVNEIGMVSINGFGPRIAHDYHVITSLTSPHCLHRKVVLVYSRTKKLLLTRTSDTLVYT